MKGGSIAHRTMWKASAVSASECARKPHISSRRKKAVSMAIMTLMRVLLDHANREDFAIASRNAAPGPARVVVEKLQEAKWDDQGRGGGDEEKEESREMCDATRKFCDGVFSI